MDKLEYIHGDLVKFATNTYTIVNFEENFLHNKICYALISTNSTKTALVADKDILPIPLTPEILEKNGWKHKKEFGEYWFVPRNEDYELLALDKVGEEWAIYIEENSSNFENIKFVHQLQHLLFGLGLNSEMEV